MQLSYLSLEYYSVSNKILIPKYFVDILIACMWPWMTEHNCPEKGLQKSLCTIFDCMVSIMCLVDLSSIQDIRRRSELCTERAGVHVEGVTE